MQSGTKLRNTYRAARLHLMEHWKALAGRPIGSIGRADVAAQLQTLTKERGRIAAARSRCEPERTVQLGNASQPGDDGNPTLGTNQPDRGVASRVSGCSAATSWWRSGRPRRKTTVAASSGCWSCSVADGRKSAGTVVGSRSRSRRPDRQRRADEKPQVARATRCRRPRWRCWDPRCATAEALLVATTPQQLVCREGADRRRPRHADWTLHDLRRSVATGMAELDVAPHVIEEILNHKCGHRRDVAGTYNRAGYEPRSGTL